MPPADPLRTGEPIPLAPEDLAILALESATVAGHTCKVVRFGPGAAGALGLDALRARITERIGDAPLLTRRLGTGAGGVRAWVPDPSFDVVGHVTAAPVDGPLDRGGVLAVVASLFAQHLPRDRPLWKMDAIALPDGGALLVWRIHHALADGTATMRYARTLLWDGDALAPAGAALPGSGGAELPSAAGAASPHAAGAASPHAAGAASPHAAGAASPHAAGAASPHAAGAASPHAAGAASPHAAGAASPHAGGAAPSHAAGAAASHAASDASRQLATTRRRSQLAAEHDADERRRRGHLAAFLRREYARSHERSPFDGTIGTRREIGFAAISFAALHDAARTLGGATVNDGVLAVVTGALRQWLVKHHGELGDLRVRVPVSLHHEGDDAGNRDSFFSLALPLGVPDPVERLRAIHAQTSVRKADHDAERRELLLHEVGHVSPQLAELATRLERSPRRFALSVSNVVGPRTPVELLSTPVEALHGLAEIGERHALRIAVTSFADRLCFGLLADPLLVPDVRSMAEAIEVEAELLTAATG